MNVELLTKHFIPIQTAEQLLTGSRKRQSIFYAVIYTAHFFVCQTSLIAGMMAYSTMKFKFIFFWHSQSENMF